LRFGISSITLKKKCVYEQLSQDKARIYNFIVRQVIVQIPFEKADARSRDDAVLQAVDLFAWDIND
jgi:hypothetical protein